MRATPPAGISCPGPLVTCKQIELYHLIFTVDRFDLFFLYCCLTSNPCKTVSDAGVSAVLSNPLFSSDASTISLYNMRLGSQENQVSFIMEMSVNL